MSAPFRVCSTAGLSLAVCALLGCGSGAKALPVQTTRSPPAALSGGPPTHIAVIVMENHEYGDIIGSSSAPYINGLARRFGLARAMYAITHPSLPNYLALTGGSTFGRTDDCTGCTVGATSIADQLARAGISWRAYMDGMPSPCYTGASAGEYAKKHDPFVYYTRLTTNRMACANSVVPLPRLAVDERAGSLPRFVWITPNLCHDMHDCSVARGDRFLAGVVSQLLPALGSNGCCFSPGTRVRATRAAAARPPAATSPRSSPDRGPSAVLG